MVSHVRYTLQRGHSATGMAYSAAFCAATFNSDYRNGSHSLELEGITHSRLGIRT